MSIQFNLIAVVSIGLLFTGCQLNRQEAVESPNMKSTEGFQFPYDLDEPDRKYKLPGKLAEISGLSMIDNRQIACVQDEEKSVYIYDRKSEEVVNKISFGKLGDYEGVSVVDSAIWMLRSNGKLYLIENYLEPDTTTIKFETALEKKNNTEGLAHDPANNRLLISSRGLAGDDASLADIKAIYAFDLGKREMLPNPVLQFSINDIYNYLGTTKSEKAYHKLQEYFKPGAGALAFHPAGIAVHPISGNYYMVSSKGNLLLVTSSKGEFLYVRELDKKLFLQPEGITFEADGDMYISNEGKIEIANILRFEYIKPI